MTKPESRNFNGNHIIQAIKFDRPAPVDEKFEILFCFYLCFQLSSIYVNEPEFIETILLKNYKNHGQDQYRQFPHHDCLQNLKHGE